MQFYIQGCYIASEIKKKPSLFYHMLCTKCFANWMWILTGNLLDGCSFCTDGSVWNHKWLLIGIQMSTEVEKKMHLARYGVLCEIDSQERERGHCKYDTSKTSHFTARAWIVYSLRNIRTYNRIQLKKCIYESEILMMHYQEIWFTRWIKH